jgi:hypothetical protein
VRRRQIRDKLLTRTRLETRGELFPFSRGPSNPLLFCRDRPLAEDFFSLTRANALNAARTVAVSSTTSTPSRRRRFLGCHSQHMQNTTLHQDAIDLSATNAARRLPGRITGSTLTSNSLLVQSTSNSYSEIEMTRTSLLEHMASRWQIRKETISMSGMRYLESRIELHLQGRDSGRGARRDRWRRRRTEASTVDHCQDCELWLRDEFMEPFPFCRHFEIIVCVRLCTMDFALSPA